MTPKPEESNCAMVVSRRFESRRIDYKVVAHQSAEKQDTALTATADMITANPDIQIIFACNEGGSIGAAMAVKQSGKKIAVSGTTAPIRSPA
jgi:ABC-type sugar transport system substrate-binding protein